MYRTNNCGELNSSFVDQEVKLSGWGNKIRTKGFIIWIDLRDRYGITQLVFDKESTDTSVFEAANKLGREFVIEVDGKVIKRKDFYKNINNIERFIKKRGVARVGNISQVILLFVNYLGCACS